jgi:hypothetical protein
MVLDIDNTLLFALHIDQLPGKSPDNQDNIIRFDMCRAGIEYNFIAGWRKGLDFFFEELKDFSKFYINTHGVTEYAISVCNELSKKYGINIQSDKIVARDHYGVRKPLVKSLDKHLIQESEKAEFYGNSIALDDKPDVWSPDQTLCPVLNSKKYINFYDIWSSNMEHEVFPYSMVIMTKKVNKLIEFDRNEKKTIFPRFRYCACRE